MSKKIFLEALINIWKIKKAVGRDSNIDQFIKFAVTGGLGTITNLFIFFVCADKLLFPEIPVSIICFLIAGTQNYIINHKWSFAQNMAYKKLSIKTWALFIGASLLGLAVNIIVLQLVLSYFVLPYKFIAQGCGIAAGMVVNFAVSKLVVFRRKGEDK
jgi:putative flippase GtrA